MDKYRVYAPRARYTVAEWAGFGYRVTEYCMLVKFNVYGYLEGSVAGDFRVWFFRSAFVCA